MSNDLIEELAQEGDILKNKILPALLLILAVGILFPGSFSMVYGFNTEWTVVVDGAVNATLSVNAIAAMPSSTVYGTIYCYGVYIESGNWVGVNLPTLLAQIGYYGQPDSVDFAAQDGYQVTISGDYAIRTDVIIAYQLDGQDLSETLRLVVPGENGAVWIAMITEITVHGDQTAECTVTFLTNPSTVGSINFGGKTYTSGQTDQYGESGFTAQANAPSGWTLDHWLTTGGLTFVNSNTVAISSSGTLEAVFTQFPIELTGITVTNGGSSYTTPTILLIGGGGSGATATAHVSNGVIYAITLANPGSGYSSPPAVIIRDPSPRAKGATATVNYASPLSIVQNLSQQKNLATIVPERSSSHYKWQQKPHGRIK